MFVLTEPFSQLIIAWFSIYYEICNFHAALGATEQNRSESYHIILLLFARVDVQVVVVVLDYKAWSNPTPHMDRVIDMCPFLSFAFPPLRFNLLFDCLSCIDLLTLALAANRKQMYSEWEKREMYRVYMYVCVQQKDSCNALILAHN